MTEANTQPAVKKKFKWRKWNNILHRDIGYVIAALTIIYSISGVAVNHIEEWNPNYTIEKELLKIEPIATQDRDSLVAEAMHKLSLEDEPENSYRPDRETLQLFYEDRNYLIDLPTGNVIAEVPKPRPVLFEMNQLHLNAPKRAWTYIADAFAVALIIVSVTGLFVLKGKKGITGRGAWLTALGVLIPVLYWVYYVYWE